MLPRLFKIIIPTLINIFQQIIAQLSDNNCVIFLHREFDVTLLGNE